MSWPTCPDHGAKAIYKSREGYYFCPRCLNALFEWYHWIKKEFVPDDRLDEVRTRNKEIAEKHIASAVSFYKQNYPEYPIGYQINSAFKRRYLGDTEA